MANTTRSEQSVSRQWVGRRRIRQNSGCNPRGDPSIGEFGYRVGFRIAVAFFQAEELEDERLLEQVFGLDDALAVFGQSADAGSACGSRQ